MGGTVALQLAAVYPDRIAAIVMVDETPFIYPPELLKGLEAPDQVNAMIEGFMRYYV